MKYIKTFVGALVAVALFAVTAVSAAPSTNAPIVSSDAGLGPWTFSLSGAGSTAINNNKVSDSAVGGEFQIGHDAGKLILPLEVGVRQSIAYADANGSEWLLGTKAYSNWTLIKLGNLEADGGGNVGLSYGNQPLNWTAAPELIGRIYLKNDVDLFAGAEYPFDLNALKAVGNLNYKIGLRVRF